MSDAATRLLSAPCGHTITRTDTGGSRVILHTGHGDIERVAPTFDAAVDEALAELHGRIRG